MDTLHFKRWEIAYDREATVKALDGYTGDPERCGCVDCRNFMSAEPYPKEVLSLFQTLGVHPFRMSEFYSISREPPDFPLYRDWFHFVGSILSVRDGMATISDTSCTTDCETVG